MREGKEKIPTEPGLCVWGGGGSGARIALKVGGMTVVSPQDMLQVMNAPISSFSVVV